jgi:hypothetical protein
MAQVLVGRGAELVENCVGVVSLRSNSGTIGSFLGGIPTLSILMNRGTELSLIDMSGLFWLTKNSESSVQFPRPGEN